MSDGIDDLIFTRSEATTDTFEYLRKARDAVKHGYGLHFPIPEIAEKYPVPPILPPKVCTIQAQSHHGKSQFLDFWKDDLADRLNKKPTAKHIIISVKVEDMIEEEMAVLLLREAAKGNTKVNVEKLDDLLLVSTQLGSTPVYHIGKSLKRASLKQLPLNVSNIGRAMFRIVEKRKEKGIETEIQGTFLDYINATEEDREIMSGVMDKKRNLQVRADFFYFRDRLLPALSSPGVVAVQSKQILTGHKGVNMLTPGLYDMQETSAIPQHTDFDFSLWMPKVTHSYGETIEHGKTNMIRFAVVDELCWLQCNKQRGFDLQTLQRLPANAKWPLRIDFATGRYFLWTPQGTMDQLYNPPKPQLAEREDWTNK